MTSVDEMGAAAGARLRAEFADDAARRLATTDAFAAVPATDRRSRWWAVAAAVAVVAVAVATAIAIGRDDDSTVVPATTGPTPTTSDTASPTTGPDDGDTREVRAQILSANGTPNELCSAAQRQLDVNHEPWNATAFEETTFDGPTPARWIICRGDPAGGDGVIGMHSDRPGQWLIASIAEGPLFHAGDDAAAEIQDALRATVTTVQPIRELRLTATTSDGGRTWTIVRSTDAGPVADHRADSAWGRCAAIGSLPTDSRELQALDLDGDGRVDMSLWTTPASAGQHLLAAIGSEVVADVLVAELFFSPDVLAATDLDGDGLTELFIGGLGNTARTALVLHPGDCTLTEVADGSDAPLRLLVGVGGNSCQPVGCAVSNRCIASEGRVVLEHLEVVPSSFTSTTAPTDPASTAVVLSTTLLRFDGARVTATEQPSQQFDSPAALSAALSANAPTSADADRVVCPPPVG